MNRGAGLTKADLVAIIERIWVCVEADKHHLSQLDTGIGDGDHGFSMAQAFGSVHARMGELSSGDIGTFLKMCGLEIMKVAGGAAGAMFGTFFTAQASYYNSHLAGVEVMAPTDFARMIAEGLAQIKKRGGAVPGDKTMVDALEPAVDELFRGLESGLTTAEAFRRASDRAADGAEATGSMVARHGRAKNLGQRSLGHVDPGAASMALVFKAMAMSLSDLR